MPGVEPDIYGVRGTHVQSDWGNDWSKFHRHAEFQDMVSQPRVPTLNFLAREDVALKAYCESRGRYLGSCHRDASPPLGVSTKLGERYVYNKSPHGDNLEFGMTSCGQFSLTAMYTQVKDVDNHGVPVEQIKARRYRRSGELDSDLASGASVGAHLVEPCVRPLGCRWRFTVIPVGQWIVTPSRGGTCTRETLIGARWVCEDHVVSRRGRWWRWAAWAKRMAVPASLLRL